MGLIYEGFLAEYHPKKSPTNDEKPNASITENKVMVIGQPTNFATRPEINTPKHTPINPPIKLIKLIQ